MLIPLPGVTSNGWADGISWEVVFGHTARVVALETSAYVSTTHPFLLTRSRSITLFPLDLTDYDSFLSLFAATLQQHSHIDAIVFAFTPYCLAAPQQITDVEIKGARLDEDGLSKALWGVVQATKVALYHLRRDTRGGGRGRVMYLCQPGASSNLPNGSSERAGIEEGGADRSGGDPMSMILCKSLSKSLFDFYSLRPLRRAMVS
jgi:NAD(P)-dependent dehydrogenase (short-subunit alcohol dehydrogenase family)